MSIPIFIITYNRLEVLIESFNSLTILSTPYEIIFCDNKSTYLPLINWLKEREQEGYTVFWNNTSNLYHEVKQTVQKWYETHDSPYFMLMDPDVVLQCPSDTLEVLKHILEIFPKKERAGIVMRWDDIPDYYPLKQRVIQKQKRLYESRDKDVIQLNNKQISYVHSDIDTTFTMFRKGFTNFSRVQNAIVTLAPYHAKHLDWYIKIDEMTEEQRQYCFNRNRFAHWCGQHLQKYVKKK